jgi:hypothetical protein
MLERWLRAYAEPSAAFLRGVEVEPPIIKLFDYGCAKPRDDDDPTFLSDLGD